MLRHRFSPNNWFSPITIALAADGIATREHGQSPKLLTSQNDCYPSRQALIDAIKSIASDIKVKRVRFIISNHFVRYGVLAWQDGIVSRQDWLALAQHDFRKRLGTAAEQWSVRVSLNGYGKPVVSCAIDKDLIDDLTSLAFVHGWKITTIEPLLMSIAKLAQQQKDMGWLMIAEPERVLLSESVNQQWQRFSIISPPRGYEAEQALQQITRSIQSADIADKPTQILTCIAPKLTGNWRSDATTLRPLQNGRLENNNTSAVWMTGF